VAAMAEQAAGAAGAETPTTAAALRAILDEAISLQPEAEAVLERCLADGPKGAALARRAHRVTSRLIDLIGQAERLPPSATVDDATGLLRYHHRLLAETTDHAFSGLRVVEDDGHPSPFFRDRLGAPAVRMRRLRDLLVASGDGCGPGAGAGRADAAGDPAAVLADASALLGLEVLWDRRSTERLRRGVVTDPVRFDRVVDNLAHLSALAERRLRPEFDWCDPVLLLRAALADVDGSLAAPRRVRLDVAAFGASVVRNVVSADHALLARAVSNIVDNALRHGGVTPVTVTAVIEHADLVVTVADGGAGLPAGVAVALRPTRPPAHLPFTSGPAVGPDAGPPDGDGHDGDGHDGDGHDGDGQDGDRAGARADARIGVGIAATAGLLAAHGGTITYRSGRDGTLARMTVPVGVQPT
jgi:hypothetical protein